MAALVLGPTTIGLLAAAGALLALGILLSVLKPLARRRLDRALRRKASLSLKKRGTYSLQAEVHPLAVCIASTEIDVPDFEHVVRSALNVLPRNMLIFIDWRKADQDKMEKILANSDVLLWVGTLSEFKDASRRRPFAEQLPLPSIVLIQVSEPNGLEEAAALLTEIRHLPSAWHFYESHETMGGHIREAVQDLLVDRYRGAPAMALARTSQQS